MSLSHAGWIPVVLMTRVAAKGKKLDLLTSFCLPELRGGLSRIFFLLCLPLLSCLILTHFYYYILGYFLYLLVH